MNSPVWGLDTGRQGEFMQVQTLGRALDLGFERIQISGRGLPLEALPATPPRLLLSFGSAARAALRLAANITPRPLLVHLGTPGKTPIDAFDLIIPMPQDDYPEAPNVFRLRLPLNGASLETALPAPPASGNCTVIIGGPSRHFRITVRAVRRLIRFATRLALANGEKLHVVTSPRTPAAVLAALGALQARAGFTLHPFGGTPFASLLQNGARFVVTSDSASMLAEACRTGAPVWLFALPRRHMFTVLQHAADRCFGPGFRHGLVRRGLVGGGTNFRRWHLDLEHAGYISSISIDRNLPDEKLRWTLRALRADTDLTDCRARILALLAEIYPKQPWVRAKNHSEMANAGRPDRNA
jgi:hypothetical protein